MPKQFTATTAAKLFESISEAMEAAPGGKYQAFNLVTELNARGLDIVAMEMPPEVEEMPKPKLHAAE